MDITSIPSFHDASTYPQGNTAIHKEKAIIFHVQLPSTKHLARARVYNLLQTLLLQHGLYEWAAV